MSTDTTAYDPAGAPAPEPAPPVRRGRTAVLVGGLLAIVAVGAGGAYAFSQLSGGGAQPESALPSTTIAFAKVDLDPSAGQKLDAVRFLRKFPDARDKVKEDSDLRKVVFDAVKEDGGLEGVDYAKDVEPWLGERAAVGLVPGATADAEPVAVVALAVTDSDAAEKSLPKLTRAMDGGACRVVEEYALCTEEKGQLDAVVSAAQKATLADAETFKQDLSDLGEDGIATAWVDYGKAAEVAKKADLGGDGFLSGFGAAAGSDDLKGRMSAALRFDGPHLELAGHVNGASTKLVGSGTAEAIATLPKGTLAAVTVANAGEQFRTAWPSIDAKLTDLGGMVPSDWKQSVEDELGISVPDDVAKALGTTFTVAFGGLGEDQSDLKVGIVTDGDRAVLEKLADAAGSGMGAGGLTLAQADRTTVLSLSDTWADDLKADHGLGGQAAFKNALPDLDDSRFAAYVDIAGLVKQFAGEASADDLKDFEGLSSFGLTASGSGGTADFSVRLTTK
jgi:hypothetical protein